MHISAAAILAICVAASNALPADWRLSDPKPGDAGYIPGCTGVSFLQVVPPSAAQRRCEDLQRTAGGWRQNPKPRVLWGDLKGQDLRNLDPKITKRVEPLKPESPELPVPLLGPIGQDLPNQPTRAWKRVEPLKPESPELPVPLLGPIGQDLLNQPTRAWKRAEPSFPDPIEPTVPLGPIGQDILNRYTRAWKRAEPSFPEPIEPTELLGPIAKSVLNGDIRVTKRADPSFPGPIEPTELLGPIAGSVLNGDIRVAKRALPKINKNIPGCRDAVFTDVFPPSKLELKCRGLIDENGKPIKSKDRKKGGKKQ